MSFLPARMSRLLVGGHRSHLEAAIEALHQEGVVHIEDYQDATGTTGIGTPLEAGEEASATLVRLRGLQKALGGDEVASVPLGAESPRQVLEEAETASADSLQRLREVREELARVEAEEAAITPLRGLEVDLAMAGSLRTVRFFVGLSRLDPRPALGRSGANHDVQVVPSGSAYAVACLASAGDAGVVEKALAEAGFASTQVPGAATAGTPAQRLDGLASRKNALLADLAAAERDTQAVRSEWAPRLVAAERALAVEVEKTQAPLRFGVTETTFHIEGWVPRGQVKAVEDALLARFGASLYFHDLGDAPPHAPGAHGGGQGHGQVEQAHATAATATTATTAAAPAATFAHPSHADSGHDEHHADDPQNEPPIHLDNPRPARPYEWILGLLARPRYQELDPSKLMLLFFPLFFGFMVGDIAVGLLIVLFGLFLRNHRVIGIGGPAVGKAIVAGGIVSILVGLFVFGEALGIHFVVSPEGEAHGEMSWENILGLHIPFAHETGGLLYKTGGGAGHVAEGALATLAASSEGAHGILSPHSDVHLSLAGVNLGYYSKIHDVQALLVWSLLIALVHINLGLMIGFRNVKVAHGIGLAVMEKGAWLTLQLGAALAVIGSMTRNELGITETGWILLGAGLGITLASLVLLWMGAARVMGQGFIALLEIPSLFGNIVSYTRLAAIGASKAGLGLALGVIAFDTAGGGIVGWAIYLVGFVGITALAILTGSLQSLRLQFVEFFGKFFTGGGRPYVPFGRRAA